MCSRERPRRCEQSPPLLPALAPRAADERTANRTAAVVRAAICVRLACLGIELDEVRNSLGQATISRENSRCAVQVLRSQEDEQIARHPWALVPRKGA